MAKCKDCLHYEPCLSFSKIINSSRDVEMGCEHFKDRTKYVEVVRCKDCHYYNAHEDGDALGYCRNGRLAASYASEIYPEPDYFCAYGERRTE